MLYFLAAQLHTLNKELVKEKAEVCVCVRVCCVCVRVCVCVRMIVFVKNPSNKKHRNMIYYRSIILLMLKESVN